MASKTTQPVNTLQIGSLGKVKISKHLFDRISGILDARGVIGVVNNSNIEMPTLEPGDDFKDYFDDFFGEEGYNMGAMGMIQGITMEELSPADREALIGGQDNLVQVLDQAVKEHKGFLNLSEEQQDKIMDEIFRRDVSSRVKQAVTMTPRDLLNEKIAKFESFGLQRSWLSPGSEDQIILDPDDPNFDLQTALNEYDDLIRIAERTEARAKPFKEEFESSSGETKVSVVADRINALQQQGLTYTQASHIVETEVDLPPTIKTTVDFNQQLEQEDIDEEYTRDLERAGEMDPRLKRILSLQNADAEQLSKLAEELGIPEENIVRPEEQATTFEPLEMDTAGAEKVGSEIGESTFGLLQTLRGGISRTQITNLIDKLKTGGKIAWTGANIVLFAYALGDTASDIFTGKTDKYDVIDTLNALNNTVVQGAVLGMSAMGVAGAVETGGLSMALTGILLGFKAANNSIAEYDRNKDWYETGDGFLNNIRTNLNPQLEKTNTIHKQILNRQIDRMNTYGNLYYEYLLGRKGEYKDIPNYNYTSDLPPTRQAVVVGARDEGGRVLAPTSNSPADKKTRYREYYKITDKIAQNLLQPDYDKLKYLSGKLYTKALQDLTNKKNLLRTAMISSLAGEVDGGTNKEIGLDRENWNSEGIFNSYDLTQDQMLQRKFQTKIYGGGNLSDKQFDTNTQLQTTDPNLQLHFETQAKLDPNYQKALQTYTDYVNNQITKKARDLAIQRGTTANYENWLKAWKPLTYEQIEHGVSPTRIQAILRDPSLKTVSTINPNEGAIHVPPSPFWVYYYKANADRFVKSDMIEIAKKNPKKPIPVVPPFIPKPKPKPQPVNPKPKPDPPKPDDPDKPDKPDDPDKPKPFNPPEKPDEPDRPVTPPLNPPYNPFPKDRYINDERFEPIGETSYDDIEVEFTPELALYLLRTVEVAYEPRQQPIRVFDEL